MLDKTTHYNVILKWIFFSILGKFRMNLHFPKIPQHDKGVSNPATLKKLLSVSVCSDVMNRYRLTPILTLKVSINVKSFTITAKHINNG